MKALLLKLYRHILNSISIVYIKGSFAYAGSPFALMQEIVNE